MTTRSERKNTPFDILSPSEPPKNDPHTQKELDSPSKQTLPSNYVTKLEYDLLKELKRTKENISLFELMKLPQIQENFIKTLKGKTAKISKEINVRTKKWTSKNTPYHDGNAPKRQVVVNASLFGKRSRSNTPPFLITFDTFNRNVHNFMVDSGVSSNVMPIKFCERLNVKPEESDIQIIQLDMT
jgi:hypothetical protein